MKRHIGLQSLSRQHHTLLLAVLLLKKGMAKKASPAIMIRFLKQVWVDEMQPHFQLEELVLIPALRNETTATYCNLMLKEHETLRQILLHLVGNPVEERSIAEFVKQLETHIRNEERLYFPNLEPFITDEKEELLRLQLNVSSKNCLDFRPKFWE